MERTVKPMINRMSREYIASLPALRFKGDIVTVRTEQEAERCASVLMKHEMIGFDTESRPSFRKGVMYPVSLLQLSTEHKAYLFQLGTTGISSAMKDLLESEDTKKVGIGIRDDIKKLKELNTFDEGGFIDLGEMASAKGIIQFGARSLAARYLGMKLVKTMQKTNWARSELTRKQRVYAATDAWVCLKLYPKVVEDDTDYRQFEEEECSSREESSVGDRG
ncbi:3'-5' exonuclease [Limisalsivibrio acetivorans]|uniref:3'-5' exonuclease n=1 Tax=Limisalsivibrio acetivorans TaxID=1304888 RepID=UPI0009DBAFEE|nr:3'-5' exonuclease [Limisalsivibrio acetivorans]